MKVSQTKLYWVAIHIQVFFLSFYPCFVFSVFLPLLSFQRRRWWNLQPVCCRKWRSLHRERCGAAGQTDPDWSGLPASKQCGASGFESKHTERLYDDIGQPIPPRSRLRQILFLLCNFSPFSVSQPSSHKKSLGKRTCLYYHVFFIRLWGYKEVTIEGIFFYISISQINPFSLCSYNSQNLPNTKKFSV